MNVQKERLIHSNLNSTESDVDIKQSYNLALQKTRVFFDKACYVWKYRKARGRRRGLNIGASLGSLIIMP